MKEKLFDAVNNTDIDILKQLINAKDRILVEMLVAFNI